uniref:dUTPase-like domain-containing protein n=1 Tax=Calidris pygmaea TaxID=425635 RepID=A0A8C3KKL8_9CHAR
MQSQQGPRADAAISTTAEEWTSNAGITPRHATPPLPGITRFDMATAATTNVNDTSVHLIPTGLQGPLPFNGHALLLGRSSTTKMGLCVLPGIIDSDYRGEIKIMVWTPNPPCTIAAGERIAQLISLPSLSPLTGDTAASAPIRRAGGFGSTG